MFRKYIVIILMFSASSVHSGGATDNAINSAVNNAMPHINSAIEDWAMRNVPQLKLIEVETRLRNYSKTDYRILGLLELQRSGNEAYLSQFSLSSFQSRETLNLGLVWRKLSPNNTLMYGGNVFYDREFNTNHSRIGFGLELKSSVLDLSKDNLAVGAKSDLALVVSFLDCSYSSLAIIKSGLFSFDISIASLNWRGKFKSMIELLSKVSISFSWPITFS